MAMTLFVPRSKIQIRLAVRQDDLDVRGNAVESGDPKLDRAVEDEILSRLDQGDVWAWADVEVQATYEGWLGNDSLGACSYSNEADFKESSGYYTDMVQRAIYDLLETIQQQLPRGIEVALIEA